MSVLWKSRIEPVSFSNNEMRFLISGFLPGRFLLPIPGAATLPLFLRQFQYGRSVRLSVFNRKVRFQGLFPAHAFMKVLLLVKCVSLLPGFLFRLIHLFL